MKFIVSLCLTCVVMTTIASCSSDGGTSPGDPPVYSYDLVVAFTGLTFNRPVDFQTPPDGSGRIFVLEQGGVIRVFDNDPAVASAPVFMDIQDRVDDSANEEGLLGLAFHAQYEQNGYFFLYHNDSVSPNRTQVARYQVSQADSNQGDRDSELVLLQIPQPYQNHNGGPIAFGPNDGYLYIGVGDGGLANDPDGNGQDRTTLLGSILRIDVDNTQGPLNYAIPSDNPFVINVNGWREEIWAWGMRNPWRLSFDPATGWLWVGDVGQNAWEEIDVVEKGKNYGWVTMEGNHCVSDPQCDQTDLEPPVWEYSHNGNAASVTGGYVYHGSRLKGLAGAYIYADFRTGQVWALRYDGATATNKLLVDTALGISSLGVDAAGELYFCAFDGKIHMLEETEEE